MKQPKSSRLYTEKHLEHLSDMIRILLEEEHLTDVTLHCKDGSLKAHRLMLAASSPYFRKILLEHSKENVALVMHGISKEKLQKIIEVIYYGTADIPNETADSMCDLLEELDVVGVVVINENNEKEGKMNGYGRDTRFKGQKRVAVDFKEVEGRDLSPSKLKGLERKVLILDKKSPDKRSSFESKKNDGDDNSDCNSYSECNESNELYTIVKEEMVVPDTGQLIPITPKLTSWDKKPRKFQCELCPSNFKRASHLTRHQLVHTGERPYACKFCDKAFSRHDKLKHHIRKNHDLDPDFIPKGMSNIHRDDHYTIGTIRVPSPIMRKTANYEESYEDNHIIYSPNYSNFQPLVPKSETANPVEVKNLSPSKEVTISPVAPSSPSNTSNVSNTSAISANTSPTGSQPKKGRGRPRKYPPAPPQLVKRPRGRPRLNPVGLIPPGQIRQNYDITNLPFGDLEYLTKPLQDDQSSMEATDIIEPLVEIKTEELDMEDSECEDEEMMEESNETVDEKPNETVQMGVLEPVVSIDEPKKPSDEDNEKQRNISFLEGIGLCENKPQVSMEQS